MTENVSINTHVEILAFGTLQHFELLTWGTVLRGNEPVEWMEEGSTLVHEIVAPGPVRIIER